METKTLNHPTMFYEDQHKLAAYLERHNDQFEYTGILHGKPNEDGWVKSTADTTPTWYVHYGFAIRPILRYGLPSHLQSEIHNPDNLTEEQICEGGKYRAVTKQDSCNQEHQYFIALDEGWCEAIRSAPYTFSQSTDITYRLLATVPWPDWEAGEATPWPEWPDPENEPDPKDACIAELEKQISELHESCENLRKSNNKPTSPLASHV